MQVVQAYGYNNRSLNVQEMLDLLDYCKQKRIAINVRELIDSDELYNEIVETIRKRGKKK